MQEILTNRRLNAIGLIFILILLTACQRKNPTRHTILLITGGHDFDTTEFYELFNSFPEFTIDTMTQPGANQFIATVSALKYDVIAFYDYWQNISEAEKSAYLELTEKGTGLLFLHHSLVSYTDWEEFSKIRGGKYPVSNPPDTINDGRYKHDLDLQVTIVDNMHQITSGMKDFSIHDEGYNNIRIYGGVTPLLKTNHPDSYELYGWTNHYRNSKVVYLMGGHDKYAYRNSSYVELIRKSIQYLVTK